MKYSIGVKLTGGLLLIFLVVVGFGAYSIGQTSEALREAVGRGSIFLAQDTIDRLDKDIFLKVEQAQLYAQDTRLGEALRESNDTFGGFEDIDGYIAARDAEWVSNVGEGKNSEFMREITDNDISDTLRREFFSFWERKYGLSSYGEAFVTNKYGANIAQTNTTSDYRQADEAWWQEAKEKGFFVGDLEYDESSMIWTVPLSVRVDDERGEFAGVVKTLPLVREIVREVELTTKKYETTEIKLLTSGGRLIYDTRTFRTFEDLSQKNFFKNIGAQDSFFMGKEAGRERLFAVAHSKGFRDFRGLGWALVIGHDTAEVFAPARRLAGLLGISGVLIFIMLAALSFVFVRSISRPIRKLTRSAEYISRGNLDVKIDIRSGDEVGQLARAFSEMARKLKRSYGSLEGKVRQRTGELQEKINELDKTAKLLVRRDMELLRLNDELQEIDMAKTHFVSVAAHQLRTPLSVIKWTFRMLLSGDFGVLNKGQTDVVQRGYDVNEGMIKLISDLLDVARIESGRFSYSFGEISIEEVVQRVVRVNMPGAAERKVSLTSRKQGTPALPPIRGDKAALGIALGNLISNAVKYTLPGGKVEVVYKKVKGFIEVGVRDTGVGVPENQLNRLFEKFFRGDNVVRMQTSGTGLGLFIAKNIISAHGGDIGAESKEGRGSTFWFRLPVK